jgi:molybdopterin/thiamine biosynthesis adenylyltransferase
MGIDSIKKQSESTVLVIGLDTLGIEIAKNLILSGLKKIFIFDKEKVCLENLLGNFFVTEKDLGL